MQEVTIPLRPLADSELGSPEEYFKVIQDEYASRYLALQGIASTAANKAAVMRFKPLEECEMHGVWAEGGGRNSAIAGAIRIVPPLRQRMSDASSSDEAADLRRMREWYGHPERISVDPPKVLPRHFITDEEDGRGAAAPHPPLPELATGSGDLEAELQRVRQGGEKATITRDSGRTQRAHGVTMGGPPKADLERREAYGQEVVVLKQKFILPFCSERKGEDGTPQLVPWPTKGTLECDVPRQFLDEVKRPIEVSLEDIRKNTVMWVKERLPLELLTTRQNLEEMKQIRASLCDSEVPRLIGLLAHLLYWLALAKCRAVGTTKLSESALQTMSAAVHQMWSSFERTHRETVLGVNLVLPSLMLALKQGIERCFELQFPGMMADAPTSLRIVDRINTMLMRLFDPDCRFSHFGKGDGTGKAILLSRQIEKITSHGGTFKATRRICRMNRCSPLVTSMLSNGEFKAKAPMVADARTRAILLKGDFHGASPAATSKSVKPPQDRERQRMLLRAAMHRLGALTPRRGGSSALPFPTSASPQATGLPMQTPR